MQDSIRESADKSSHQNPPAGPAHELRSGQWPQCPLRPRRMWPCTGSGARPARLFVQLAEGDSRLLRGNSKSSLLIFPAQVFRTAIPTLDCRLSSPPTNSSAFPGRNGRSATCDLVGSSYGGATALMLAALAPSRVRRLVLVSPANPWSGNRTGQIGSATKLGWWQLCSPRLARPMRPLHDYFLRRMWGDPRPHHLRKVSRIFCSTAAGRQSRARR